MKNLPTKEILRKELNWVLENMKIPNIRICNLIESRMNEIILKINKTDSLLEADPFR